MATPDKPTEAEARWLRSVQTSEVTMTWGWGSAGSHWSYNGTRAKHRGVLDKIRAKGWIYVAPKQMGSWKDSKVELTPRGLEVLEGIGG